MKYIAQAQRLDTPPLELEINIDTIYKRNNIIASIDEEGRNVYTYEEKQYTIEEYLREAFPQNEKSLGELSMLLTTYQLQTDTAIAELSIAIGGKN